MITYGTSPGRGRGVFATQRINTTEIIEVCPLLYTYEDHEEIAEWTFDLDGRGAVALGYGSLYNHSLEPNAVFEWVNDTMVFTAIKQILAGREILINYNGDPDDKTEWEF